MPPSDYGGRVPPSDHGGRVKAAHSAESARREDCKSGVASDTHTATASGGGGETGAETDSSDLHSGGHSDLHSGGHSDLHSGSHSHSRSLRPLCRSPSACARVQSLFVHVPSFETLPPAAHLSFAANLMEILAFVVAQQPRLVAQSRPSASASASVSIDASEALPSPIWHVDSARVPNGLVPATVWEGSDVAAADGDHDNASVWKRQSL